VKRGLVRAGTRRAQREREKERKREREREREREAYLPFSAPRLRVNIFFWFGI
jgi:hypothetical protein